MSTNHPPRAILFDMDGVLVDSVDCWFGLVNKVRVDFGFETISRAQLMEIFGQGVEDDAKNLYPGHEPLAIRRAYDRDMPQFLDRMKADPDTLAVLHDLERKGVARAVVTNTQHTLATDMLRAVGLERAFDVVAAAGREEREKPHPDMLHLVLETLDVPVAEALMVGDTSYDAQAAQAAGVPYLHFDLRRGGRLREALDLHLA